MSWNTQNLGARLGLGALAAVSDGELNMIDSDEEGTCHSLDSSSFLPAYQLSSVGKVASWAVSFERLLDDPTGVRYFTAFLKSEVSMENILFWQSCEKFQQIQAHQKEELATEARSIFDKYLSDSAFHAVNIDEKARVTESDLQNPTPDMFCKAQQQIFKLMKFDSYTRFIRSQLFQKCMLADVEGRPLPGLGPGFKILGTAQNTTFNCLNSENKKNKVQSEKYSLLQMEAERKRRGQEYRAEWDRGDQQRGLWETKLFDRSFSATQSDTQRGTPRSANLDVGQALRRQPEKYCCVFLPDGTASLTPARSGVSIRDMLGVVCEKRGFALEDVTIYLQEKDKQPLILDQDSSVLREQQVFLELRVKFVVEIVFTGNKMGIEAKSSKTLQEALSTVLLNHGLRAQETVVTMSGSREPLKMDMPVFPLANKTLFLDRVKGKIFSSCPQINVLSSPSQYRGAVTAEIAKGLQPVTNLIRPNARARNTTARKTYDMDGFAALLSKAQWRSADDQRGLLSKEQLVMPSFLELSLGQEEKGQVEVAQGESRGSSELSDAPCSLSAVPALNTQGALDRAVGGAPPDRAESEAQSHSPLSRPDGSFFCSELSRETVV
ncbi:hypothetical protein GJAV_G00124810 [Gymnothorax javanicus]|nr:hypothetical protein GJAV_G00124810 [Gymnothorax javanicus]